MQKDIIQQPLKIIHMQKGTIQKLMEQHPMQKDIIQQPLEITHMQKGTIQKLME